MTKAKIEPLSDQQQITLATLEDLGTTDINVIVTLGSGEERLVPMRTLTLFEWDEIGLSVPDPTPQIVGSTDKGTPLYDTNSADYQRKVASAGNERRYRRLAAALKMPIPGDDLPAKAAWIRDHLDGNITLQLINILALSLSQDEARIAGRSFHSPSNGSTPDHGTAGMDNGAVESASE